MVLLLLPSKVAVLPQELALQRISSGDALGGVEDEPCVLLSGSQAVGDVLLGKTCVTRQVGLLGRYGAIQRVLGQLLLVLVVLAVEARGDVAQVLGKRVLRLLHGIVIRTTTERTVGGELRSECGSIVLVVAVDDVLLRLVDHLTKVRVLAGVLVGPHVRGEAKGRIDSRVDAVLTVCDALQSVHLRLLTVQPTVSTELAEPGSVVLLVGERGNGLAAVLFIRLVVDLLRLVEIVLVRVRQPLGELDLGSGRRVLRLRASAHDIHLICLVELDLPCMTRHGGGRGVTQGSTPLYTYSRRHGVFPSRSPKATKNRTAALLNQPRSSSSHSFVSRR